MMRWAGCLLLSFRGLCTLGFCGVETLSGERRAGRGLDSRDREAETEGRESASATGLSGFMRLHVQALL
jgi:hypothetical protein